MQRMAIVGLMRIFAVSGITFPLPIDVDQSEESASASIISMLCGGRGV